MRQLLLILIILPHLIKSQLPNYNFAFAAGSPSGTTFGLCTAKDGNGNIYVCGTFDNLIDLDPSPAVFSLNPVGFYDVYLAKYNSGGQLLWGFNIGSAGDEGAYSVMVDAGNNIFLSGYVNGICDFDPSPGTATLGTGGGYDCFIAKYNGNGQYQWGFTTGSTGDEWNQAALLDASGNIYITGPFQSTVDFNPAAGVNTLASTGGYDIFLAKYNSSGVYQWALSVGDPAGNEMPYALCNDASGNVVITGSMQGTCDFDPSPATANLVSIGTQDIFMAKYNSSGQYVWAYNMGCPGALNLGRGVKTDASGNVFLTGYIGGTVDLNPGLGVASFSTTSFSDYDIFLAKYNSSGQYQWAFNIGGGPDDEGECLAVDAANNIYVGGTFNGTADFNAGPGANILTAPGSYDGFIAKYDPTGQHLWSFNENASGQSIVYWLNVDGAGNIFATGNLIGTGDFDPSLAVDNITSVSTADDMFLAKYSSLCTPVNIAFNVNSPSCPNNNDGTATVTAVGGTPPYSFDWGPAAGNQTTQVATNLTQGIYNVLVIDNNNCAFSETVAVNALSIPVPTICMVTVDSISANNVILWNKNQYPGTDTFYVYRDIANNNYALIGKVPKNATFGEFRDTVRTLYPANGDPQVSSWKYKIAIKDSCGNLSLKSPYHKTLFIQHSLGNFIWNDYHIEGQAIPVPALNNYIFKRDNNANGTWINIQTLSASSTAFTDPNYNSFSATADWRVETIWNIACQSSYQRNITSTINRSKSNVSNNRTFGGIGLKKEFLDALISVYPNPTNDFVNIETGFFHSKYKLIISNLLGQKVFESGDISGSSVIDVRGFLKGLYFLHLETEGSNITRKLQID